MGRRELDGNGDIYSQYLLSFYAHNEIVTIHPWTDGNGRMSRLVMNYIQFEFGLAPTKVFKDDKAEYINALNESRENDAPWPFRTFMLESHIRNLRSEISTHRKSLGK